MARAFNILTFILLTVTLVSIIPCFSFFGVWPLISGILIFLINFYDMRTNETGDPIYNNTFAFSALAIFLNIWRLYRDSDCFQSGFNSL